MCFIYLLQCCLDLLHHNKLFLLFSMCSLYSIQLHYNIIIFISRVYLRSISFSYSTVIVHFISYGLLGLSVSLLSQLIYKVFNWHSPTCSLSLESDSLIYVCESRVPKRMLNESKLFLHTHSRHLCYVVVPFLVSFYSPFFPAHPKFFVCMQHVLIDT